MVGSALIGAKPSTRPYSELAVVTCHADVSELSLELREVATQALDLQPHHSILKLDRGEFGCQIRCVAAALCVSLVYVYRTNSQVGHRAVLGIEQVGGVRRCPERRGQQIIATAQQLPLLKKLDPGDSIPPRFPLALAPVLLVLPIISLEARHRQTPRLTQELQPH